MNLLARAVPPGIIEPLRQLAALEYALIDACQADADAVGPGQQAVLAARAKTAQVHLLDLAAALRQLGDACSLYSRFARMALLQAGTHAEVLTRLERAYLQVLGRGDVPGDLEVLLRSQLVAHGSLRSLDEDAALCAPARRLCG